MMTNSSPGQSKAWARLLLFALGLVAMAFSQSVQGAQSYIYVETDIGDPANMNSIAAYSNDGSGNLVALPGSPYLTGGTGINAAAGAEALDADQQVIANPAGTALYAVNGHSNDISVFTIKGDGTLSAVRGSPFPSGGQQPASLALSGSLLIVANKDQDPNQSSSGPANYATFPVKANGGLSKRPGAIFPLAEGSHPAQVLMASIANTFFGMVEFESSYISTFAFDPRGTTMTETSTIPSPSSGALFLGEILHPTQQILYAGIVNRKQVGVYTYDANGVLTFVRTVSNPGSAVCWLCTNAAGTRLFTSESLTSTLSVYDISRPLKPTLLQHLPLLNYDGVEYNLALDLTESFLYAIAGTQLHVLNVDASGLLSETAAPVHLPGVTSAFQPVGLAVVRK